MSRISVKTIALAFAFISSAAGANTVVQVGKDGLTFTPPKVINANPGDTITYNFNPKNHSVIQSSFADPCHPLSPGFFSGFVPTTDLTAPSRTTFTITVNDTKPIWIYCGQAAHCQSGMVHSINAPTSGNTFEAFQLAANKSSPTTTPLNGLPIGGLRKTTIGVGPAGALMFSPNNITELPGTVVEFSFNPKNHSVVQSSFSNPCQPSGFSSGFNPTTVSPSGTIFDITLNDTKPVWFYCAQTVKTHCQAGMVGSINAPTTGNTIEAFVALAAKAGTSTIPPNAPIGGILSVNGSSSSSSGTATTTEPPVSSGVTTVPPPGATISNDTSSMAGGSSPASYGWATSLSDNATTLLQIINFVDNALLDILINGHNDVTTGQWSNQWPNTIKNTVGSMGAQAIVHRSTSTDSLSHYSKKVQGTCNYNVAMTSINDFVSIVLTLTLLEIGLLLDVITQVAVTDTWLVAPLATTLGSKARMSGMVNMMQNHIAAAAPREVSIPTRLVYSYVMNHYVVAKSCPDTPENAPTVIPPLTIAKGPINNGRLTSVTVTYDSSIKGNLNMAWMGPWGKLESTVVTADPSTAGKGTADVPTDLSGHVWGVLTNGVAASSKDLPNISVAGPEIVWVTQP